MGRPPRIPELNPYTLSERSAAFYRARAAEGVYPSDLAVQCLRNEEERNGTLCTIERHKRPIGRPRKPANTPLEKQQAAMKIRMAMEARAEAKRKEPQPVAVIVHAETEVRIPPVRISLSYEECMARKAW